MTTALPGDARVMDAEHLELPDASYDVALCAFGLFFFPEPEAAMAEVFRVVRPGGTVAVSTWGPEDERWSWEDDVLSTLTAERRAVVRPFDSVGEIEALLVGAGFTGVANELDHRDMWFADEEAWWAWKWSTSLRGVLEQQDEATLAQLRRDAENRMRPFKQDAGLPCRLTAHLVSAHR